MNFGLETFRKLIEDFLTSSGGRRGREREQRREREDDLLGDDTGSTTGEQSEESVTATDESADESTESESEERNRSGGGGGIFSRGSGGGDEDIDDLFYRIEELEEELESKGARLGSVRDSQEQVADQVEEVNETVRQLLGVYDMVTDDVNPFTGEGEEQNGFGVFGEDEADDNGQTQGGFDIDAAATRTSDDETVSFDDLKGVIEDAAEAQSSDGRTITFDEDEERDDTHVEVRATESVDQPADDPTVDSTADDPDDDDRDDVTLTTLADSYATDLIVFEWLTQLVRTAGSAATLRAISYYAEIGWIGEEVKKHLEGVLSGPDLDIHVDPGTTPDELTAEDHADSYTYIMKLQEIHETKREIEPRRSAESRQGP